MTSILRKLRGGRRKSQTKPSPQQYDYDGRLSIKSTDSSHASDVDYKSRRPLHEEDEQTHPMQEQSPSQYSATSGTPRTDSSRRHIHFPFIRRKSDPSLENVQESVEEVAPRRIRFGRSKSKESVESRSTRLDASGSIHHQYPGDEQAMNREAERIARAAAALDNRGNELFERGYFDKAMEAYSKALKLKRRTFHSMLEEADEIFDDDGDNVDYSKSDPKLLVSMATSINNIGYLRQRAGDATPDETMAAYKKSLRIKRKILGNDSLSVGKTLNNVGSVHYLKKEFDGAIPAYEEALQIMQANLGDDHPDVATVMSNMGDVHLAKGDPEISIAHYRNALNIRWAAFGEHDPRVIRLLEKIARIEIGDKMTRIRSDSISRTTDWDESELFDLDTRPIAAELHTLHEEVEEDMQYVDSLQKRMAVDMVKDKVNILRGMRELWGELGEKDESQRSSSYHDDDGDNPVFDGSNESFNGIDRDRAHQRVKDRIARLRSQRAPQTDEDGHDSARKFFEGLLRQDSVASTNSWRSSKSNMLGTSLVPPQAHKRSLSGISADGASGGDSVRSAIKLRNGINSLRSMDCDELSLNSSFSINSKKSQMSKKSQP